MFKALRIGLLLLTLLIVSMSTWLSQMRSTDWNNSLYVKIYPISADRSRRSLDYIAALDARAFAGVEAFMQRELERYGHQLSRPVRIVLGQPIAAQPPVLDESGNVLHIMLWSLKTRWWARSVAAPQDDPRPDVRIFVRYHEPGQTLQLENSVGVQRGMFGIVNAYAGRRYKGMNNVVIAHEFLHTLGATDKYDRANGQPIAPEGLGEPQREPLYPQRHAEIMGGRIAIAADDSVIPKSLKYATIGELTASEVGLR